jgi:hypothetical protein
LLAVAPIVHYFCQLFSFPLRLGRLGRDGVMLSCKQGV